MTLDFIYLLAERGHTLDSAPSLEAQILDRIKVQHRLGVKAAVVAAVTDQSRFESAIGSTLNRLDISYRLIPDAPVPVMMIKAARALRSVHKFEPTRSVYVREPWSSLVHFLAFPFNGPQLTYDMRGDAIAESQHRGRSWLRRALLGLVNKRGIKHARKHMAVSSHAARQLTDHFGVEEVNVVPSCVDYEKFKAFSSCRASVRARLGVSESDVLVVYSGGTQAYQMIPETLIIWEKMAVEPNLRFMLLTHGNDPDHIPAGIPKSRLIRLRADRDDVPAYLSAGDIGFLLRAQHQLNHVASPIKFGEYLATGLSVISTPGIGDVSTTIERHNLGRIVHPYDVDRASATSLELVRSLRDPTKRIEAANRAREIARDRYDWAAYAGLWKSTSAFERD